MRDVPSPHLLTTAFLLGALLALAFLTSLIAGYLVVAGR